MKSSITTAIAAGSLLLTVNAAMAVSPANPIPQHGRAPAAQYVAARPAPAAQYIAARPAPVRNRLNVDVAQFIQGMLGGGAVPYANLVRDVRNMPASSESSYDESSSPSYDASAAVSSAAIDEQALSDEENQINQEINDTNAMTASMAAAEQENDAANAATLQTEINAGM
jgi:hypothetical protein